MVEHFVLDVGEEDDDGDQFCFLYVGEARLLGEVRGDRHFVLGGIGYSSSASSEDEEEDDSTIPGTWHEEAVVEKPFSASKDAMKDSNNGEQEYSWEEDSATWDVISIMIALAIVRVVSDNGIS